MKFYDNCSVDKRHGDKGLYGKGYKNRQAEEIRLSIRRGDKPGTGFVERDIRARI